MYLSKYSRNSNVSPGGRRMIENRRMTYNPDLARSRDVMGGVGKYYDAYVSLPVETRGKP